MTEIIGPILVLLGFCSAYLHAQAIQGARWPSIAALTGPTSSVLVLFGLGSFILARFPW